MASDEQDSWFSKTFGVSPTDLAKDAGAFVAGAATHIVGGIVPGGPVANAAFDAAVAPKMTPEEQYWYGAGSVSAGVVEAVGGAGAAVVGVVGSPFTGGASLAVTAEGVNAIAGSAEAITAGMALMSKGGGRAGKRQNEKHLDEDDPRNPGNQPERISDGTKAELQESGWLKEQLPDVNDRRDFMKWLEDNHRMGEEHNHLAPGSPEAQTQLNEWMKQTGHAAAPPSSTPQP